MCAALLYVNVEFKTKAFTVVHNVCMSAYIQYMRMRIYSIYVKLKIYRGKKYSDEEMNDIIIQTITLTLPLNLPRDCVRDTIKEENFIGKCVHLSTGCVFDQGLQRPVLLFGVTTRPNVT